MDPLHPSMNRVLNSLLNTVGVAPEDILQSRYNEQYHVWGVCHGGDNERALSITWRPDHEYDGHEWGSGVWLKCHTKGCDQTTILKALKLSQVDLYDVPPEEMKGDLLDSPEASSDALTAMREKFRARFMKSGDLNALPEPIPLIEGVLECNADVWLIGKAGHGKSFLALDWAGHISQGMDWNGHKTRQGTVVYVFGEGAGGIRKRVRAWEEYYGTPMENVIFLPVAVQLLDPVQQKAIVLELAELDPVMVIFDTQARMTVGVDENSATEMGEVVAALAAIREATGATVVSVHHQGRNGENARGSSAVDGAADIMIRVEKAKDSSTVMIHNPKQKNMETFETFGLTLTASGESSILIDGAWQTPAERKASEMDQLGVPLNVTVRGVRDMGIKGDNGIISEALKLRRKRAGVDTGDLNE